MHPHKTFIVLQIVFLRLLCDSDSITELLPLVSVLAPLAASYTDSSSVNEAPSEEFIHCDSEPEYDLCFDDSDYQY